MRFVERRNRPWPKIIAGRAPQPIISLIHGPASGGGFAFARASELLPTGRFIVAARAERVGLVSAVYPEDEVREAGWSMAREILANSPVCMRLAKECLNMSLDAGFLEAVVATEDR